MYWINFLHIYQPISQTKEILDAVTSQSYRPLFAGFLKISNPNFKINVNINGCLSELLWKHGHRDVIENIKALAEEGKLEFTGSAKYHCFLPYLPEKEIERQIILNHNTNKKIFGKIYQPKCFFPPEMAYSEKVAKVVSKLGYKFILLDEISYNGKTDSVPYNKLFSIKNTDDLIPVFRERRVSNLMMSGIIRDKNDLVQALNQETKVDRYLFTGMDGEIFGHHRPGLEKSLLEIVEGQKPKQIFVSELPQHFPLAEKTQPLESTWASCQDDIEKGVQFYSWKDPKNKVHQYQWQLLNFVLKLSKIHPLISPARKKLDKALASDQFYWASGEPWWSVEMIEKGAWELFEVVKSIPNISETNLKKANRLYQQIITTAFWWQRSGKIDRLAKKYKEGVKIPFIKRTDDNTYQAFLAIMRQRMKIAVEKDNFEKAILWREAISKLETKNDIYDAIHAVDLLRQELAEAELKKLLSEHKEAYRKLKPGQPESRRA